MTIVDAPECSQGRCQRHTVADLALAAAATELRALISPALSDEMRLAPLTMQLGWLVGQRDNLQRQVAAVREAIKPCAVAVYLPREVGESDVQRWQRIEDTARSKMAERVREALGDPK